MPDHVDGDDTVQRGLDDQLVTFLGQTQRPLGLAPQVVGAFTARGIDQHEGRERDNAREREHRHGSFVAQPPRMFETQRQRAGEQRHQDGGRQQASRHAATHTFAGQQLGDPGIGTQRECAGADQDEDDGRVRGHVDERNQCFAAEHEAGQTQPADHDHEDRQRLMRQSGLRVQRAQQTKAEETEGHRGGWSHARWQCAVLAHRQRAEGELVQIHIPGHGVAHQDQQANAGEQQRGKRGQPVAGQGAHPLRQAAQHKPGGRDARDTRPARHQVGQRLHVEHPADEHEDAECNGQERGELREVLARSRALHGNHGRDATPKGCAAAIS